MTLFLAAVAVALWLAAGLTTLALVAYLDETLVDDSRESYNVAMMALIVLVWPVVYLMLALIGMGRAVYRVAQYGRNLRVKRGSH